MGKNAKENLVKKINFSKGEPTLFTRDELPKDWEKEWGGMPEFKMGNTEPVRKIVVNFASEADVEQFAKTISRHITSRTNSIWFPQADDYVKPSEYLWIDES